MHKDNIISQILRQLYDKYRSCEQGAIADYIPELAKANPDWFGISVFTVDGHSYEIGDTVQEFTIQSISKAFTYGIILDEHGLDAVEKRIGVEPSGEAFNSISLDPKTGRPLNPMINAGAIAASAMVAGIGFDERFDTIRSRFGRFAGRSLGVDENVYRSESATGFRNRAIANLLRNFEMLDDPVDEAVEVYFKQCSILVTCRDLAVMAATLANGGVNPVTGERALKSENVDKVLSVMSSCGMYDYSGEWIFNVGLPAKSGVGGGVLGVLPGQLGVAVFSPLLDAKGNSIRGVRTFADLSQRFNLHLFNYPVISDQAIRRVYHLNEAGSHRQRPKWHHEAIRRHGEKVSVIELQGDIFFSAFERLVRSMGDHDATAETFVLDLTKVGIFDHATKKLLLDMAQDLKARQKELLLVSPHHCLNESMFSGLEGSVRFFAHLDLALETCEDKIVEKFLEKPLIDGLVPFHEFEIFQGLTPAELSQVEGLLEMACYPAGCKVVAQGSDGDYIYLLSRGSVSIYQQPQEHLNQARRLRSFGPGVCFGDFAVVDGTKRSADVWADDKLTCYLLSLENLALLEDEARELYTKILRNILAINIDRLRRSNLEINSLKA